MPVHVRASLMPVDARTLAEWHFRTGAIDRLLPPWEEVEVLQRPAAMVDGAVARFRMRKAGLWIEWVARHHDVEPGRSFSDTQERGPFRRWTHRHSFLPKDDGTSMLEDHVDYDVPGGVLGRAVAGGMVERDLARMFAWRHARTRHDLAHHARFPGERLRVAVSGTGGMVGGALLPFLSTGGHDVRRIVRGSADHARGDVAWDPKGNTFDAAALEGLDAVVHLAGAGIADSKWTPERKRVIRDSRVLPTHALARTLAGLRAKPRVLVCASAIGWYGDRPASDPVDEASTRGHGYLAAVCEAWERAADPAREAGIRVVHVRIGVV
ncbi:MAG: NAD-dependent epimerase/dehydratase family protein, partial [Phycisphaerales bacterium]